MQNNTDELNNIPYEASVHYDRCLTIGSFWRHYKTGTVYQIVDIATDVDDTTSKLVIYKDTNPFYAVPWARESSNFLSVINGESKCYRFEKVRIL